MIQSIQVLRFHLLELEKVCQLFLYFFFFFFIVIILYCSSEKQIEYIFFFSGARALRQLLSSVY